MTVILVVYFLKKKKKGCSRKGTEGKVGCRCRRSVLLRFIYIENELLYLENNVDLPLCLIKTNESDQLIFDEAISMEKTAKRYHA